jgi:hypothetical protein
MPEPLRRGLAGEGFACALRRGLLQPLLAPSRRPGGGLTTLASSTPSMHPVAPHSGRSAQKGALLVGTTLMCYRSHWLPCSPSVRTTCVPLRRARQRSASIDVSPFGALNEPPRELAPSRRFPHKRHFSAKPGTLPPHKSLARKAPSPEAMGAASPRPRVTFR